MLSFVAIRKGINTIPVTSVPTILLWGMLRDMSQVAHRSEKPNNKLWASFTSPWK